MRSPLTYTFVGNGFRPSTPFMQKQAERQFTKGERYTLGEIEERSDASHRHEFAWLKHAWQSLPEDLAEAYASPEHLRKRALIQAGFYHEQALDAGSNAAAIRMARFIGAREEFSVCVVKGPLVVVRTAKSQSRRSMDKAEFQASKQAIIDLIADMIGTDAKALQQAEAA